MDKYDLNYITACIMYFDKIKDEVLRLNAMPYTYFKKQKNRLTMLKYIERAEQGLSCLKKALYENSKK